MTSTATAARARPRASSEGPGPGDTQPTEHETLDRFATGLITVVPFVGLGVVVGRGWGVSRRGGAVAVFPIVSASPALGVPAGSHRHFTHRSFATKRWVRGTLAILGSAAIEG